MSKMHSLYCPTCHVLLLKAKAFYGEVKCHKCKNLVNLKFVSVTGLEELLTRDIKSNTMKVTLKRSVEPRGTASI